MPGDELVPRPSFNATRAITIDAPPEDVWPWLIQIGHGARRLLQLRPLRQRQASKRGADLSEHQHPRVGDWVPMAANVNETTAFKIKAFEQNRLLLWEKPHSTLAWKLEPIGGGRTRLVTRLRERYSWRADPANALLSLILFEVGDFPMMRKLLLGVKQRAEGTHERPAPAVAHH